MENSFQTSFIPKKPISTNTSKNNSHSPTSIFTVLSFILLIIVGISSVGLFLYKNYLTSKEASLSSSLEVAKSTFQQDTIKELELYNKRVSAAKSILDNHIVLSPMFKLLGDLTIPSVQYTDFSQDTSAQVFSVKLSGVATDYKSIALQSDAFNTANGRSFRNVVFSNINKDKNNNITFDVEFTVDPSLLSYSKDFALTQATPSTTLNSNTPTNQTVAPVDNTSTPSNNQPITSTPSNTTQ